MEEDITQSDEYIKGYKKRMKDEERLHDGTYDTPYYQGFNRAGQEIYNRNRAKAKEELAEKGKVEYNTIIEIIVMVENLDERLKKLERYLEKYTQE